MQRDEFGDLIAFAAVIDTCAPISTGLNVNRDVTFALHLLIASLCSALLPAGEKIASSLELVPERKSKWMPDR